MYFRQTGLIKNSIDRPCQEGTVVSIFEPTQKIHFLPFVQFVIFAFTINQCVDIYGLPKLQTSFMISSSFQKIQ